MVSPKGMVTSSPVVGCHPTHGWPVVLLSVCAGLAVVLFCTNILRGLDYWGRYDWHLFFFHAYSRYRSVVEFGEPPLWNPWYIGGFPMVGNPQAASFNPFFLLDLRLGLIAAIRLKIVAHYAIGLGEMYSPARRSWPSG
jgi:hypothetical protein